MTERGGGARAALLAGAGLLAFYVLVSLACDPAGYLGTDTGGKIATLRAMDAGDTAVPDIGYWAEDRDPAGDLHPLYYTAHLGDRWVNLTTLPAVYAGYPLYRLGGYRAALLVPMLGAVAAAFAARALARRLRLSSNGWTAFWLAGLASPLAVYALDFWEHSLGVAAMGWAAVFALDVAFSNAGDDSEAVAAGPAADEHGATTGHTAAGMIGRAGLAGGLFGVAATMRTEAIVYGGVIVAVALGAASARRLRRSPRRVRRVGRTVVLVGAAGVAAALAFVVPLALNNALERAVLGQPLRADRAQAAVSAAPTAEGNRVEEALVTLLGLAPSADPASWISGLVILAAVATAVAAATSAPFFGSLVGYSPTKDPKNRARRVAVVLAAFAAGLYAGRVATGLGFVPGLVATTPLAAAALVHPRRWRGGALLLAFAAAPLPLVWAFQYTGGAIPQWGGRYILLSGFLLATAGAVAIEEVRRPVRIALIGAAAGVTMFGVAWLAVRSHGVAGAGDRLAARSEPLVFRVGHLAREEGARYDAERRWLTAVEAGEDERAADLLRAAGHRRITFIDLAASSRSVPPGWTVDRVERLPFLSGVDLRLTTATSP